MRYLLFKIRDINREPTQARSASRLDPTFSDIQFLRKQHNEVSTTFI